MTRQQFGMIVSILILAPYALNAVERAPRNAPQARFNQIYVKVIMPADPADRGQDRSVESWIAQDLKKLGQARFSAVTAWVPLDPAPFESTDVWDGKLGKHFYCPVGADIERAKGPVIKVHVSGWSPGGGDVVVPLRDEPGSRVLAPVSELKTEQGMPYVALLIGPPPRDPAAPANRGN